MLLKRLYDTSGDTPKLTGLRLIHTGTHAAQTFSRRLVDAGIAEGWLTITQGHLTLHTAECDLMYAITRMPGLYCCHCGASLGDDASGGAGRAHVAHEHADMRSPDPAWPSGYLRENGYACVLDAKQHAQWQRPAGATVSHYRST